MHINTITESISVGKYFKTTVEDVIDGYQQSVAQVLAKFQENSPDLQHIANGKYPNYTLFDHFKMLMEGTLDKTLSTKLTNRFEQICGDFAKGVEFKEGNVSLYIGRKIKISETYLFDILDKTVKSTANHINALNDDLSVETELVAYQIAISRLRHLDMALEITELSKVFIHELVHAYQNMNNPGLQYDTKVFPGYFHGLTPARTEEETRKTKLAYYAAPMEISAYAHEIAIAVAEDVQRGKELYDAIESQILKFFNINFRSKFGKFSFNRLNHREREAFQKYWKLVYVEAIALLA